MFPQPKPIPKLLDKRKSQADLRKLDREQRAICQARSGGRCEVRVLVPYRDSRCIHRATENHHLIGGMGRRNVGRSRLAEHRLHVCAYCHAEITAHVLVPCVDEAQREQAATVRYERRK